jgi:tRNA modification GTPase
MRPARSGLEDTIVALATPPGRGAIAIVRLSGSRTRGIAAALVRGLPSPIPERRPVLCAFADRCGTPIDRGLLTFFPAPRSFTGEDVAELSLHGNPLIADRILRCAIDNGARAARAGEFSERAYLAGKIDLVEAEAIGGLVEARTDAALRIAAAQLSGELSSVLGDLKGRLQSAAMRLAASIDFVEDVGEADREALQQELTSAAETLVRLAASHQRGRLLAAGCRVVIAGRPNVGKSTVFNGLIGSARAIVTAYPGTTRDTLEEIVDIGGVPARLIDTAGLRESGEVVERIGVDRAREQLRRADLVLFVFDGSAGYSSADEEIRRQIGDTPAVSIANKSDLGLAVGLPGEAIAISAREPRGIERARQALAERLTSGLPEEGGETITSIRQHDVIARAARAAEAARRAHAEAVLPEYVASHVDEALEAIADVVGETSADDVLDGIFRSFCIGK